MVKDVIKELIRYTLLGLAGLVVLPLAVLSTVEKYTSDTQYLFHFGAHTVALVPGLPGNFVRAAYYIMTLNSFHPTAIISFGSYFSSREASLAYKAGVGAYCVIGRVAIGPRVRLASRVSIVSGLHSHGSSADYGNQTMGRSRRITIGAGAWVGEGALVAADVGEDAMVSIGAVVIKPVPPGTMAMGNPARILPLVRQSRPPSTPTDADSTRSQSSAE